MVLAVEEAEPGGTAVSHNGAVHGKPLCHIAAVVLVGVDEEDRGLAVGGILERGLLPEKLHILSCIGALVVYDKGVADIRVVLKGYPVGDGTLGYGCFEAVGVAHDPVGHEAAVGAAGNAHTGCIDLGISL